MKDESSKELLGMVAKQKAKNAATEPTPARTTPKQHQQNASSKPKPLEPSKLISKKDETATHDEDPHSSIVINEDSLSSLRPQSSSAEDNKVEVSEPNTVRSILDRAKEVLKTLDYDSGESTASNSQISKRGGIIRKQEDQIVNSSKFVNDTARAVKQVAALAQTLVKHAEAKAMLKSRTKNLLKKDNVNERKTQLPQQQQTGFKRSGFVVEAGPGQFGNTP